MSTATEQASGGAPAPPGSTNVMAIIFRLAGLAIIDAFTLWLVYGLIGDGSYALAIVIAAVTIWINFIFLNEKYYPLRWISPGLALMIVMVLYPIFFTVMVSFSNYGQGHLVTKTLATEQIESQGYLPEDAAVYNWTAYQNLQGDYNVVDGRPGHRRDLYGDAGCGACAP